MHTLSSTSAAHGFKDFEYPLAKAPGVFRIFVLGDSLAFGQGVRIDESFSKMLERMLNRKNSSNIYEVINSSVPGMNAVQEHCLQKTLGVHYEPDLYLIALCHNDAELQQPESYDNYDSHVNRIWDPDGDTFPYFAESLRRMKATADSQDARIVVAYFVFCDDSLAPQAPDVLAQLCRELDIPFTNVGKSTGKYPPEKLWVNDVETHPNALAHRVAARHLAGFLSQSHFLPETAGCDEGKLLARWLETHAGHGNVLGAESVTNPLARVHSLLRNKLHRKSFNRNQPGCLPKKEIEQAIRTISPLLRRSQLLECLDGYDTYLKTAGIQNQLPLFDMKQMVSDLGVSIFYLGVSTQKRAMHPEMLNHAEENPTPPNQDGFQEAKGKLSQFIHSLESLALNLNQSYNGSLESYQTITDEESFLAPALAKIAQRLTNWATGSYRPFALFVAEAHRVGLSLQDLANELSAELERFETLSESDFPDTGQFRKYQHFAWETVDFFLYTFEHFAHCVREVNVEGLANVSKKIADGTASPWAGRDVEFEITVQAQPGDDYTHLGLYWTNIVPISAMQRDTLAIQTDGKDHAYRFKFFTGVMGYFALDLKNGEANIIRNIRMHLNGKCVREWAGEQLETVLQNGLRSELLILTEDD